ncbi:peptidoglycan-binding protein [Streptomyces olivochromogenes]|uniref:peptidoglycan-binding domain-containing protein n=1 Tax=Streptomyces TaxID=1883 RepID=UPI0022517C61|nr:MULTISPECIES: peptidoglycan-binding domain-containing protein [unclassified Streptomyces]MCX4406441.1 peptidoglycan-binding protein [Streptomyces sp. NBC_01764]MCX5189035.1 peptidoglycan-binding protein [Streptomyces sp. NBC_00268]
MKRSRARSREAADESAEVTVGSRLYRRRRWTVVAACCAAVLSAAGMFSAQWVQSPAEAAARTRAPRPSVITAPVVRQVLRNSVVFRGTFSNGRTISVTPTSVATTENGSQPTALLITGVFARTGQRVKAARPLVEYDERPVFALPGTLPMYRNLTVGEKGKDIAQLQRGLRSLGWPTGSDASGTFGSGTAAAVRRMYAAMGYAAPLTASADTASANAASSTAGAGAAAEQPSSDIEKGRSSATPRATEPEPTVMLPASEAVFVPSLPARVVSVPVQVGDTVKGPVITLARGDMTLTGFLDPSERRLIATGMKAEILAEATGVQATGAVDSVGAVVTPGSGTDKTTSDSGAATPQNGSAYVPVKIKSTGRWDKKFADQDVRITITAAATAGAVTAVPEAAVSAGADALTTVTVVTASGAQLSVPVTVGVSADGLVQVTPVRGHTLRVGDRVVVGK